MTMLQVKRDVFGDSMLSFSSSFCFLLSCLSFSSETNSLQTTCSALTNRQINSIWQL